MDCSNIGGRVVLDFILQSKNFKEDGTFLEGADRLDGSHRGAVFVVDNVSALLVGGVP